MPVYKSVKEILSTKGNRYNLVTSDYNQVIKSNDYSDYNDYKKVNVAVKVSTKREHSRVVEAEAINKAMYIADKLRNPSSFNFYLKCVWNLTEPYLDKLLAISLTKNDPKLYFSKSAAKEMRENEKPKHI